jgi:c-di-GMP-binding flagellar brake protein YcgR
MFFFNIKLNDKLDKYVFSTPSTATTSYIMAIIEKKFRSKRANLRFNGGLKPVSYKTEFEDGIAKLINISAGGAALIEASLPLSINTKILITLESLGTKTPFEIQALVLRAEGATFSVKFLLLEDTIKKDLIKYFARMTRNN